MAVEPQTLVIKAELGSVREAREFVALAFGGWGLEDRVARTVISELTANAIRHGSREGDQIVVRAYRWEGGGVVIEAWDRSDVLPVVQPVDFEGESGRGLQLVEALARRWGARPLNEGGKAVWAEIDPVTV